jgi:hypothetical protein
MSLSFSDMLLFSLVDLAYDEYMQLLGWSSACHVIYDVWELFETFGYNIATFK